MCVCVSVCAGGSERWKSGFNGLGGETERERER